MVRVGIHGPLKSIKGVDALKIDNQWDCRVMVLSQIIFTVMLRATKYRIYPTFEQRRHLAQSFGCCRFAWNYALNLTNETYKTTEQNRSGYPEDPKALTTAIKPVSS
jgi:hypothetical protein